PRPRPARSARPRSAARARSRGSAQRCRRRSSARARGPRGRRPPGWSWSTSCMPFPWSRRCLRPSAGAAPRPGRGGWGRASARLRWRARDRAGGSDRDKVPGDPAARAPGSGRAPAPVTASVLDHLGDDLVRGLVRRRALTLDADRHLGEQRGDRPDGHEYRRDGGRHRGDGEARGERDLEQGLPRVVLDEDAADVALPDELAHLRDERVTGDLELLVPRPAVAGLGHLLPLSVDGEARMTDRAAPTRITRREQDPSLGRDPALGGRGRVARPAATPRGPRGPTRTTAR